MSRIRRFERASWFLLLLLLVATCPKRAVADLSARIAFDIPAQPLSSAILRYAEQSGVQVTSLSELLSGRRTRGVRGTQSAQAGLRQLLEDTGLTFEIINPSTVTIREAVAPSGGDAPAVRQLEHSAAEPGANTTIASMDSSLLDEVIVSARKQRETLVDVPQSVTAYSSQMLQEYNIRSFSDYATQTPNLSFSYGTGALGFVTSRSVAIRGIGGAGTTALYIDDTPVPESVDPRVVDIERIEVLRGPQGTLYGQSSLGGNVRLITVEPSFTDSNAHISAQAGATSGGASPDDGTDFAGTLVAIPDRVAIRAVGFVNHDAGFLTRTFHTDNGAGMGSRDNQGAIVTGGGSLSVLARVTDNLSITLRTLYQRQDDHGWPATWAQLPRFIPASYTVNRVADVQEAAQDEWYLPSLQLEYAGRGWSLTSSTSYFSRQAHDIEDGTEGTVDILASDYGLHVNPFAPIPWDGYYIDHRVVHETRVSLRKTHGLSGVVGVYLSKIVDNGILNSHNIPGIAAAGLWPTDLGWYSQNETEIRSNAIFGELYYDIGDFELTLGARRYYSRQNGLQLAEGALNGQLTDQILEQTSEHGVSPKLALSYKLASDTMMYALASKGFRAGGAGELLPPICEPFPGVNLQPNRPTSYGSDYVWNYEVGAKSGLLDNHLLLTGSLFNMNWTDIQQSVTLPRCFVTFVTNAGAARARGGELELLGHPWQALELRAGVGFDNAIITNQGFSQEPVGSRVYQVPRWTWMTGGTYRHPLSLTLSGFVTLDLSHIGDSVSGTSGIGTTALMRPSYTILKGRLGVQWSSNELAVYANNIANERANLGDLNPISYAPVAANGNRILRIVVLEPLQVGLQFRHTFY